MGSIIECVKRIYKIQTPNGIEIKVESEERPISGVMTAKLLQEDKEICFFFEKCKILRIENIRKEEIKEEEIKEDEEPIYRQIPPFDRINMILKIEGDFTRLDYQKLMKDSGYNISNFMGHGDMEDALLLRRIERTGEKIGKGLRKYKVINTTPVDNDMYREMKRQNKSELSRHKGRDRRLTPTSTT